MDQSQETSVHIRHALLGVKPLTFGGYAGLVPSPDRTSGHARLCQASGYLEPSS